MLAPCAPRAPRSPRTPAALVVLVAVASLAVAATAATAADEKEIWHKNYVTMLHKGPESQKPDETRGPFFIPDGQCSGVLDALLRCPAGEAVRAVRVHVTDRCGYARIVVRDSLRAASVVRAPPCAREAAVVVHFVCGPMFDAAST